MKTAKDYFNERGYVLLENALSNEECNQLTDYMFELYDKGALIKDNQCPLSDSIYNDQIFQKIHEHFAKPIGDHIGKKLLPTYSYARIYRNGEVLKKHVDREACEISATITLGYDAKFLWTIFVDDQKETPIDLQIGEMMVYKGCEVVHWRPAFKGNWHVQLFLHYVDADGKFVDHQRDNKMNPNQIAPLQEKQLPSNAIFPDYICIDKTNYPDLTFSSNDCKKILSHVKDAYPITASVGGDLTTNRIEKDIRSAKIYMLDYTPENKWIFEKIARVVVTTNTQYFGFDLTDIRASINLIEYTNKDGEMDHYNWHVDIGPGESATRKLSVVVQLSESFEYNGCNLVLNSSGIEYTASKERGSVHLFPSYTLHKVTPIIAGTRYSLVTWIHGARRFK